jgi:putative isomerase
MKKTFIFFLFLNTTLKLFSQNIYDSNYLERIFKCDDVSFLCHNFVASHNPAPHGWEKFTHAQSPVGRFTFPDVMSMHTGNIYTFINKGEVSEQTITKQTWLPWLFSGENDNMQVQRTVGENVFLSRIRLTKSRKGLAIFEFDKFTDHYYRNPRAISLVFKKVDNKLLFTWQDYTVTVAFSGSDDLMICQDPEPMLRKFQGFDDVSIVDKSVIGCFNRNGNVFVGASFDKQLDISISVTSKKVNAEVLPFDKQVESEKQYWLNFLQKRIPSIDTKDPVILDTYYFAWVTFWSNQSTGGSGMTPYPYFSSAKFMYPMEFYWDEAFHSVILSHLGDKTLTYQFLKNFYYSRSNDGSMPGSAGFPNSHVDYMEALKNSGSGEMMPPILGITLQSTKQRVGLPDSLRNMYEIYAKNIEWYFKNYDSDKDGLLEYKNSFASGCDNSQRWDGQYEKGLMIGNFRPVEAIDLNVWMVNLLNDMADIALQLGTKDAVEYRTRAKILSRKIEEYMWDESTGFYYDIDAITHTKTGVKSHMGFAVLHLPDADRKRIKRIIDDHLLNPKEFWTAFPVPSTSLDDETFNAEDMWRGPVWININWMIFDGLQKQGYSNVAKELALKTIYMVGSKYSGDKRIRTPRFNEWFNPLTGEPLGNENLSWSCLVIDMILKYYK